MYELNEGIQVALKKKITPKILKSLDLLGLLKETDPTNMLSKLIDIYTDNDKIKILIETMFEMKDENLNYEEIDLGVLFEAYQSFFLKLVGK